MMIIEYDIYMGFTCSSNMACFCLGWIITSHMDANDSQWAKLSGHQQPLKWFNNIGISLLLIPINFLIKFHIYDCWEWIMLSGVCRPQAKRRIDRTHSPAGWSRKNWNSFETFISITLWGSIYKINQDPGRENSGRRFLGHIQYGRHPK